MINIHHHRTWILAAYFMCLGMVMWVIIEIFAGFFSQHYTSFEIVWMRYSFHMLGMLIIIFPRYKTRLFRTPRLRLQLVRGMLMMGMHLSFIVAIHYLHPNMVMSGFWVTPLLLLTLSAWRGERANWIHWAGTLVAFGGTVLILRPTSDIFHPATLLSFAMAICFALYMLMTRNMPGEDLQTSLFYTAFSVWIVLSFILPFYWITPNLHDLLIFAAIGLLGYFGIYGLDRAVENVPLWVVAPFAFTQPLFYLIFETLKFGYLPSHLAIAGAGIIIICITFLALQTFRTPISWT